MNILDAYFDFNGPGAAMAVVIDGEPPHLECRGLADLDDRRAIDACTTFDLASLSKVFTASAIMQLFEAGALDLDAPIYEYLAAISKPEQGRSITLRDLLQHTSGIHDYLENGMYADPIETTDAYITAHLAPWCEAARPGLAHVYSNTNYVILGKIIEVVSGQKLTAYFEENLFEPCGMKQTFTQGASVKLWQAKGYINQGYGLGTFQPSPQFELDTLGDGGIFSSLGDLLRWQALFWKGQIIKQSTLDLMTTPGRLDSGQTFDYGLGLQIEQGAAGIWCGHGGSWTNATTLLGRYVDSQMSVLVLSNEMMAPVERISQCAYREFGRYQGQ